MLLGLMAKWPHDRGNETSHFCDQHGLPEKHSVVERNCCEKTTFLTCQYFLILGSRSAHSGCRNCSFSTIQPYSTINQVEKGFKRHLICPVLPKRQDQSFSNRLKTHCCYLVCTIIPLKGITSHHFSPFCLQCPITSVEFPEPFFFTVFGESKSDCLSHRSVMFVFPALFFLGKFCIPDTADIYNLGFAHFWGREGMWLENINT